MTDPSPDTTDPRAALDLRLVTDLAQVAEDVQAYAARVPRLVPWLAEAPAAEVLTWLVQQLPGRAYNGWPGYASWAMFTWCTSDPDYDYAEVMAEADPRDRAEALRLCVAEGQPLADDASLWADLLGWALDAVDWQTVADALAEHYGLPD